MTEKARGMPDMSLKKETVEKIEEEKKESIPDPADKIFEMPSKPQINLEITGVVKEDNQAIQEEEPILKKEEKPKRKVSQKQLDALKRGREKSLEVRRARSEANKERNKTPAIPKIPKNHVKKSEAKPMPLPPLMNQPPPVNISQPSIDYDKIINGVANRWQNFHPNPNYPTIKEEAPAFDKGAFEQKIREDEKIKILNEITRLQDEEDAQENMKTAQRVLTRNSTPSASPNPFSYAFNMNARNRFQRY